MSDIMGIISGHIFYFMKDIIPLKYKKDIFITPNFIKKRFDKIQRNNNANNNDNRNRDRGNNDNNNINQESSSSISFPSNNNFASYRSEDRSDQSNRFVPFERPG